MSRRTWGIEERLHDYMLDISLREPDTMRRLRAVNAEHPRGVMQISPEVAQFLQMLVKILGAERCIEVGTFTGYSALAVALALPVNGQLIACDVSEEYTAVGRPFWEAAGVAGKIDLRIAPAVETLDRLLQDGEQGRFDFAFVDADKPSYPAYHERCLALLRPGGVVAYDNIFMGGNVAKPGPRSDNAEAMRAFNALMKDDRRVDISTLPVGDGLTLARKL